jgi:hypothetical protein
MNTVKSFYNLMWRKRKWIIGKKHNMPQILIDPKETLGGVPNNTTLAKKFLGEARGLRNGLLYSKFNRKISVNVSTWCNDLFYPTRMRKIVKLPLRMLKKIISGKNVRGSNRFLSLPQTSTSVLQSLIPIMPPVLRSLWSTVDRRYENFLDSHQNSTYHDNSLEFCMYEPNGGWEFARPHLKRYTEPYGGVLSSREIMDIVERHSSKWTIPYFDFIPKGNNIKNQYVNPHSYSGFWTSMFWGNTKRQAVAPSNVIALALHGLISKCFYVDTSLKTLGGREKAIKYKELGEETVTRVIMQEETAITQVKQNWARHITNAYKHLNKISINTHGIGLDLLGSTWRRFNDFVLEMGGRVLVGDVVSNDSSVREDVLLAAFSILRASYPDKDVVDKFFFFFTSGHVYKRVVLPGGYVYLLIGGIQSGCPFTSHVNTIATRIMLLAVIDDLKIQARGLITYGDDWMVYLKQKTIDTELFIKRSKELLGVSLKDVSFSDFDNGSFETNAASLLKTGCFNGLPGRHIKEVVKNLRFSGKYARGRNRQLFEVAANMFMYSWGNFQVSQHILEYIAYVYRDDPMMGEYYTDKLLSINFRVYMRSEADSNVFEMVERARASPTRYYGDDSMYEDRYSKERLFSDYMIKVLNGIRR